MSGAGDGTVTWTYNVANSATQYLAEGQTATESFTIQVSDSHSGFVDQTVTVTITGTNDKPTLAPEVASTTLADTAAADTFAARSPARWSTTRLTWTAIRSATRWPPVRTA